MSAATHFAPAERASRDELTRQRSLFSDQILVTLLDSVTDIVAVLNGNRQIVFANRNLLQLLDDDDAECIVGLRPGELLLCEHSLCAENGCGTSAACRSCEAVNAILCGLGGSRKEAECRITKRQEDVLVALDLKVCASPLDLQGERFVLFAIHDISSEKRRRALERIFFHDILNTAGGLQNLAQMILEEVPLDLKGETLMMHRFSKDLVDEIMAQRLLLAAESDELSVRPAMCILDDMVRDVADCVAQLEIAQKIEMDVLPSPDDVLLFTDPALLRRVLLNMLKNAVEASPQGGRVQVRCYEKDGGVEFATHNTAVIPDAYKWLIFQRSFTTKGAGRGLGTYSMKLLTNNYLKGQVRFRSGEGEGTTFYLWLPFTLESVH
ncbi:sensor histidine kinase [Oleidesulfovibrio sp.]|uniref:sensor histidine kinase n=1 Tax=Oleidesulfovibrio sp. TaxID=2909707 RepID=UPI003A89E519